MRIRIGSAALIALAVVIASCSESGLVGPRSSGIPQGPAFATAAMPSVRISEIHYDNTGTDAGEAIEISGPTGTDLTGYQLVLYNGNPSSGASYNTQTLTGTIPETCGARGVMVVNYATNGIQNGGAGTTVEPDGVALVSPAPASTVIEFLSYEGTFAATNGPASGMTSTNIGVAEAGTEPVGQSLQRMGDNTWLGPMTASFGTCNDEDETPPPPPAVAHITVSPPSATIAKGATQQFTATATDASNQPVSGVLITWSTDPTSTATVTQTGLATGLAPGDARIIATANGVADTAELHVNAPPPPSGPPSVRFSEIHYDDVGTDIDERIEIAGPAGTDLTGWKIYLYNGNGGVVYAPTVTLSGTIPATCGTRGVVVQTYAATAGIQNGAPDGMALVDAAGTVMEFLSYEGAFSATDGPAIGMLSTDILVLENGEPEGQSLQRNSDGTWYGPAAHSFGACNVDFTEPPPPPTGGVTFSGRNSSDPPLPVGFQDQLFATVTNGSSTTVTWSSETPTIASIDQNGVITALAAGTAIFRATAPDGSTGTWSLPTRVAVSSTTAQYQGNTEFGEPTDADASDDFIVRRPQYTASYNKTRGIPNWVSYDLDPSHFGPEDRCDCFTFDPLLPATYPTYTTADYTGAGTFHGYGIDRGHLARSFDRTTASFDNATTFYFSNIIPQAADLNQGPWATMENYLGDLARLQNKEVYIIAGPAGSKGTLKNEGKITIPEKVWKVAVIMPHDQGLANIDDLSDFEVIAVIAPNDPGVRSVNWETWKTTVDAVEALSGYDLLALLRDDIEIAAESGTRRPHAVVNGPFTSTEGTAIPMSAAASTDPDADALTFAWTFGDGGVATGATVSHTYAQNGTFTVRLIATDTRGLADTVSTTAAVANVAPVFAASTGATIYPGDTYTGTGSFTDPGADTFTATVNYGDGSAAVPLTLTGKSFTLSHRYLAPGTYTVTVTVSDGVATSVQTRTVTVLATAQVIQNLIAQVQQLAAANKLPADYARRLTSQLNRLLDLTPLPIPGANDLVPTPPKPSSFMPLLMQLTQSGQELDKLVRSNRVTAADGATVRSGLARVLRMRVGTIFPPD